MSLHEHCCPDDRGCAGKILRRGRGGRGDRGASGSADVGDCPAEQNPENGSGSLLEGPPSPAARMLMPIKYVWAWKCNQMISAWLSVGEKETGHAVILCTNPKNPHGNVGYWQLLFDMKETGPESYQLHHQAARLRSEILNPDSDIDGNQTHQRGKAHDL